MKKILTTIIVILMVFCSTPVKAANACYQCNGQGNVYRWSSNGDTDYACPSGYHVINISKDECISRGASVIEDTNVGSGTKTVMCAGIEDIPAALPKLISNVVDLIKIATPIILIIMGMSDFLKSVVANDEKGMNDGKTKFIKRLISGVIVFVVISIVELVFNAIGTDDTKSMSSCINCFINGKCYESSINKQHCSDFHSAGTCSTKDDYGNLCKWENNKCSIAGSAQTCEEKYTTSSSCNGSNDDYGYTCKWENNTCKQLEVGKYCSEYSYDECPSKDAHGYICVQGTTGGRPACIPYSRDNVSMQKNSCSDFDNLIDCNSGKDIKGNSCLWQILDAGKSGVCEIMDPNALG